MNKQEAVKELESLKTTGNDVKDACYNEAIKAGILAIKQIDEPRKPVVPQFVADWFEGNKGDLEKNIFYECVRAMEIYREERIEFQDWFSDSKNRPIETLIRMKGGYEVGEPLYCVIINGRYLTKVFTNTNVVILVSADEISQYVTQKFQLTEKQIKAIDERYWAFAVPVEEVAAG